MNNGFTTISFSELKTYSNKRGYTIVDLRDKEEFLEGHVEGAINMPSASVSNFARLNKNQTYILYCHRGSASFKLAGLLTKKGYNVMAVVGGYNSNNSIKSSYNVMGSVNNRQYRSRQYSNINHNVNSNINNSINGNINSNTDSRTNGNTNTRINSNTNSRTNGNTNSNINRSNGSYNGR